MEIKELLKKNKYSEEEIEKIVGEEIFSTTVKKDEKYSIEEYESAGYQFIDNGDSYLVVSIKPGQKYHLLGEISDVKRYLAEDCYLPNEIYGLDGFGYKLFYSNMPYSLMGERKASQCQNGKVALLAEEGLDLTVVICVNSILLIVKEGETVIEIMRLYPNDNNLKVIKNVLQKNEGCVRDLTLSNSVKKSVSDILSIANFVTI